MSESSSSDTQAAPARELRPEQVEALRRLREKVRAEYLDAALERGENTLTEKFLLGDDSIYLRFLRARRYDIDKAFEMLMAAAKWRRDFQGGLGVENITEESIENELLTGKSFFYKYDKINRPIVYVRVRFHKSGSILQDEMERFIVWHMENGRKLMKPGIENTVVIYDMAEFGLSNMDYNLVKTQIGLLQNYYPESLGTVLILNAPWIFKGCWALIRGWIDPVSAKKVNFVTQPELLNFIDEENLLVDYGGKDTFKYEYIPISKREELGRTDFKPTWLMDWATEWKPKPEESSSPSSSSSSSSAVLPAEESESSDSPAAPSGDADDAGKAVEEVQEQAQVQIDQSQQEEKGEAVADPSNDA